MIESEAASTESRYIQSTFVHNCFDYLQRVSKKFQPENLLPVGKTTLHGCMSTQVDTINIPKFRESQKSSLEICDICSEIANFLNCTCISHIIFFNFLEVSLDFVGRCHMIFK